MGGELERPLPQNLEAERAVLGAVILDNTALDRAVSKGLKAEDFFLDQHRRLYDRMIALAESTQAIDEVTLYDDLLRRGELESVGGAPYISAITDGMPRVSNVEHYATIVMEKSLLRQIVHRAHAIEVAALEGAEDADEVLNRAEASLYELSERRLGRGPRPVKAMLQDAVPLLERLLAGERGLTGLSTGYSRLDRVLAGLQSGELILIAARPSVGKTALALNLAENVAVRAGLPVLVFSLEMSEQSLLVRLLCAMGRVDWHKLRSGFCSDEDGRRLVEAMGELGVAPLWVDDAAASTVVDMMSKARRMKREHGLGLVMVDYVQLVGTRGRFASRREEVGAVSRGLKAIAKELRVPVVALSQLTRAPEREDRRPVLSDLRETGDLEQDADVVLFIHRAGQYRVDLPDEERAQTELIVAKQRMGPTEDVKFIFLSNFTRFEQAGGEGG